MGNRFYHYDVSDLDHKDVRFACEHPVDHKLYIVIGQECPCRMMVLIDSKTDLEYKKIRKP